MKKLKNNYPKAEYSGAIFFYDTSRIMDDLETGFLTYPGCIREDLKIRISGLLPMEIVDQMQMFWHSMAKLGKLRTSKAYINEILVGNGFEKCALLLKFV